MVILVMSDSHSGLRFMRRCVETIRPTDVVHLGDLIDDGKVMEEENPHIRFHLVPGNCDFYSRQTGQSQVLCYEVGGVRLFMTHGHLHGVKSGLDRLLADTREHGAQAVLFGHTHEALCYREQDGLWVLNPGSCRSEEGSVGVIQIEDGKISACSVRKQADLEHWSGGGSCQDG